MRPLNLDDPEKTSVLNRWARDSANEVNNLQKQVTQIQNTVANVQTTVAHVTPLGDLPGDVSGISVSENGYIIDGVLYSEVTCTYTAPSDISDFSGIYLVVKNYRGSSELVKVAEHEYTGPAGGSASFKVTLQRTNETITVYFVAKNTFGLAVQDWSAEPNTTVALDGNASAPAAPSGLSASQQALGVWLTWNENLEDNMKAYNVYRYTSNTPSSAVIIGSAASTGTGSVSFFDKNVVTGTTYYYWVTAINTAKQESVKSSGVTNSGALVSLDNDVADGTTYGRVNNTALTSGSIDFSKSGFLNKTLDYVLDGTRAAWDSATQKTAAVDLSGNLILKNKYGAQGTTNGPNTSSNTYSVIPEMSATITTKGNKVMLLFVGTFNDQSGNNSAIFHNWFAFFRDGVQISPDYEIDAAIGFASPIFTPCLTWIDTPSAGSHTYDVRWRKDTSGAGFLVALTTQRVIEIVELG